MTAFRTYIAALLVAFTPPAYLAPAAMAQSLFAPVVMVNDIAITGYDIDQRVRFLGTLGASGDLRSDARKALTEEALMREAIRSAGVNPSPQEIEQDIARLAERSGRSPDELRRDLAANGVEEASLTDFARVGLAWRELIRSRYLAQVTVTEEEIDRALTQSESGLRALISELILPLLPGQEDEMMAFAQELGQTLKSQAEFERAARRYSSGTSRDNGGRLDWLNLSDLAPAIASRLIGMAPGQVSEPVNNGQAIFLFYLRSLAENRPAPRTAAALDYMHLRLPGAGTAATTARLAAIRAGTDRCSDLWMQGRGLAEDALTRQSLPPADIPAPIRTELALLDAGELSTRLTSANGTEAWVLMLCGRSAVLSDSESRAAVARELRNQRLGQLADSYLAELRATARIEAN